jgi:hypothetical protein
MSTWMVFKCFRHMELKCKLIIEAFVLDGDPIDKFIGYGDFDQVGIEFRPSSD